jgi:hypothetical protein
MKIIKIITNSCRTRIKALLPIFLFFLSISLFAQEVTKIVVVNKPIKYVYRVTLESLNKCNSFGNWLTYVGAYYDDNDTASIYVARYTAGLPDSYRLKKIDKEHTEISYYKDQCLICSMSMAEAKLEKTLQAIKDGDKECQDVESSPSQNLIK